MSSGAVTSTLSTIAVTLGVYSIAKFLFFVLGYDRRRAAVEKQYAGGTHPPAVADWVLLAISVSFGAALLAAGMDPIAFLGGLFVGATLIQLFFHSFNVPVPSEHAPPEPVSPLKMMSYAIQDRPARAWKQMLAMTLLIGSAIVLHYRR